MKQQTKKKIDWKNLSISDLQFQSTAHYGHNVSHAKNRTSRTFKRNLHRATVIIDGIKHKVKVPTGVLSKLKEHGFTPTYKKAEKK
ncbi:MAG: hypothetical protein COU65_04605 [Candidatus Pacebacteria bacterium CG10_big_fil_rev_8_21_14_0_10_42_12]|nr:MAG: hypothetical protein COU65_04605 [Candidatus Pacebacteria bacterium CG10_big_fil_rev_8_21_14_0_10_42_12]